MKTMPKPSTSTLHNISAMSITLIFLLTIAFISDVAALSFGRYAPGKSVVANTNRFLAANHRQSRRNKLDRRQNYRRERQQLLFQSSYDPETTNDNYHQDEYNDRQRHEYTLEANSDPTINESCSFTEDQIHLLIAKRLECKKRRKFDDADKILDALNRYGIYLQDKQRKYRVDGQNHFGRRKRYVQRGGSYGLVSEHQDEGGTNDLIAIVEELVEERARYKRMREYHKSDEITIVLKEKYGVKVNDRRREWMVEQKGAAAVHDDGIENNDGDSIAPERYYVPTLLAPKDHPTHTMSDETKTIIQNRLKDRSMARKTKDYTAADQIRDELMEEYSILIDDRTKEWKVVLDSSSTMDEDSFFDDHHDDDPFAREAQLSQRSAFVQKSWEIPFDNHIDTTATTATANDDMDSQNERNSNANANREESSLDAELSRIIVAKKTNGDEVAALLSPPISPPGDEAPTAATATAASTMDETPPWVGESGTEGTTVEAPATMETVDELNALTVVALKEKLRNTGLPVSGKKSELVDRILSTPSDGSTQ